MMAQAMVDSAFTAPHVTEWITVDVTRTMKLVERLKAHRDFRDVKVSPLLRRGQGGLPGDAAHPGDQRDLGRRGPGGRATSAGVNLGIAAATPRGLVVPNVKGADALSLPELGAAHQRPDRVRRARARRSPRR